MEESSKTSWRSPLGGPATDGDIRESGGLESSDERGRSCVVALGKFDAMHLGHRSLVEKAASMGEQPWMISFSGMAAELGERMFGSLWNAIGMQIWFNRGHGDITHRSTSVTARYA